RLPAATKLVEPLLACNQWKGRVVKGMIGDGMPCFCHPLYYFWVLRRRSAKHKEGRPSIETFEKANQTRRKLRVGTVVKWQSSYGTNRFDACNRPHSVAHEISKSALPELSRVAEAFE